MAPPTKRPKASPKAPTPAAPDDPERLVIRGLTAEDHRAIALAQAAVQAQVDALTPGTVVSRNAVALGLLREGLAARAAKGTP
jgi:hypothetical protein